MAVELSTTHDCPSSDELHQLNCGHLNEARQRVLKLHLDQCTDCCERLEEIALGGDKQFSSCIRQTAAPRAPKDSAYWNAMSQVELEVTGTRTTHHHHSSIATTQSSDNTLAFLQPTTRPNRIGKIGPFEVIDELGRGGMGIVLRAYDESLKREVAIKVLDQQLTTNKIALERFCREAQAAAKVTHENIVGVYQVSGENEGLPYIVMQLVKGKTLEARLKEVGKLSIEEAVRVGMQAAAGLAAAHEHSLIHRDIKPANILIEDGSNKAKLTDFGLARADEDSKLTRTGFVAGTPLYMAPEQARGDVVDARSDLFSLGSVLYESLAGRPPFEGKTPLVVLRRLSDDRQEPLHKLNPDVPVWLEDIVNKLLLKDPAKRYQTAAEVRDELAGHYECLKPASQQSVAACPINLPHSRWRDLTRNRFQQKVLGLVAGSFLFGAVAGAGGSYLLGPSRPRYAVDNVGSPRAVENIGPSEVDKTESLKAGAVWSLSASPDGQVVVAGMEDGSIKIWNLKSGGAISELGKHDGSVWSVNLTPDGNMVVSASGDGTVRVWDLTTHSDSKGVNNGVPIRSAAMNEDQSSIVTGDSSGNVKIWDIASMKKWKTDGENSEKLPAGDKPRKEFQHKGNINAVAFSPDGALVASGSSNKSAILWDVKTGKSLHRLTGHEGPVYSLAFSPDGLRLATASWDHSIMIWNTSDGSLVKKIENAHEEGVWSISFRSCGRVLASAGQEGLACVWNLDTGEKIAEFSRHKGTVHTVQFTDKGKQLLTGGRDGTIRLWQVK